MFQKTDFEDAETRTKLVVIINDIVGNHPLTSFQNLSEKEKCHFNKELNTFISKLPVEGFREVITNQYENILTEKIFTEDFQPQNLSPVNVITNEC